MASTPNPILLIEDNPDHAELIIDVLTDNSIANPIVWMADGERGLDFLFRRGEHADRPDGPPAIILLDIKLPGLDGIEVLRLIKADESLKPIPVIMLTTSNEEAEAINSYLNHANSYVVKPVQFAEFQEKVRGLAVYWILTSRLPDKTD